MYKRRSKDALNRNENRKEETVTDYDDQNVYDNENEYYGAQENYYDNSKDYYYS